MQISRFLILLCLLFGAASCKVQQKIPNNYLENLSDTTGREGFTIPDPMIQKNDLLSIQIFSASTQPEVDAFYNLQAPGNAEGGNSGFLVDVNGNIEYPRLGILHVEGLTKAQVAALIKKRLTEPVELLRNPTVLIRFLNYKVTVLGQVGTPGSFNVPNERMTILEAVGMAGDITEYGRKTNVKVMREVNGQRQIGTIDLTSKNMFESPFYRLQQNDVVFVEQSQRQVTEQQQQRTLTRVSIATSVITTTAIIINLFRR